MAEPDLVGALQVGQDMAHERREWRIERIAWGVFALILAAALAGAFGDGPLARGRAGAEGSALWVDYERIERASDRSRLDLFLRPPQAAEGVVRLSLNRDYIEAMAISQIRPQPHSETLAADRIIYTFEVAPATQPLHIAIEYEANTLGSVPARLALDGGPSLEFAQFVLP